MSSSPGSAMTAPSQIAPAADAVQGGRRQQRVGRSRTRKPGSAGSTIPVTSRRTTRQLARHLSVRGDADGQPEPGRKPEPAGRLRGDHDLEVVTSPAAFGVGGGAVPACCRPPAAGGRPAGSGRPPPASRGSPQCLGGAVARLYRPGFMASPVRRRRGQGERAAAEVAAQLAGDVGERRPGSGSGRRRPSVPPPPPKAVLTRDQLVVATMVLSSGDTRVHRLLQRSRPGRLRLPGPAVAASTQPPASSPSARLAARARCRSPGAGRSCSRSCLSSRLFRRAQFGGRVGPTGGRQRGDHHRQHRHRQRERDGLRQVIERERRAASAAARSG